MMADSVVHPMIEPDTDAMRTHLVAQFGGDLDGCRDGLIEVAWTTPAREGQRSKLNNARFYPVSDMEGAIREAAAQNRVPGQNVYIGAALRLPETPPMGRAGDEDFYCLTALYLDCDDEGAASRAKAVFTEAGLAPTLGVITGRHPHARVQFWWRLLEPIRDPALARALVASLAAAMGGDPTVANPSRVMRLAGTIAWPLKPGRVLERTDLATSSFTPAAQPYAVERLAAVWPPREDVRAEAQAAREIVREAAAGGKPLLQADALVTDGREAYMRATILACLIQYVGETGTAPTGDDLYRAAWPQYAAHVDFSRPGRGAHEFAEKCEYTARRFAEGRIEGLPDLDAALVAWSRRQRAEQRPSAAAVEAVAPVPPPEDDEEGRPFRASSFVGEPPPRQWVIPDWLPLREVTSLYGDGGVGKTLLAQQLATCVATGRPFYEHDTIAMPVLAVLCEDAKEELHRRQNAINAWVQPMGRPEGLDRFWMWARAHEENVLVSYDKENKPVLTDFYARLLGEVAALPAGDKLVILDTLADVFAGSEISRAQVNHFVKAVVGRLVKEFGATVLMLGHPSVAGQASGSGMSGSSAWNAAVRSRWYLERLDAETDPMGDRRVLVRKKSNYAKAGPGERLDVVWQEGVLARFVDTAGDAVDRIKEANDAECVWAEIAEAWRRNQPYSDRSNATNFIGRATIKGADGKALTKPQIVRMTQRMIEKDFVRVEVRINAHRPGLNAHRWVKEQY